MGPVEGSWYGVGLQSPDTTIATSTFLAVPHPFGHGTCLGFRVWVELRFGVQGVVVVSVRFGFDGLGLGLMVQGLGLRDYGFRF